MVNKKNYIFNKAVVNKTTAFFLTIVISINRLEIFLILWKKE